MAKGGGGSGGGRGKGKANPSGIPLLPAVPLPAGTIPQQPPTETHLGPHEIGPLAYERKVRQFEAGHWQSPVEHAAAYDANGNLLYQRTDQHESQVGVPGGFDYKGGVFSHNHPGDWAFSFADVQIAMRHKLSEMRAIGTNEAGQKYRFVMRPPKGGWQALNYFHLKDSYQNAHKNPEFIALGQQYQAGKITRNQLNERGWDVIWHQVAGETGLRYSKKPAG